MRQLSLNERKARRRSHRVRRILLGVTALIVLLAGGAFGYDWYLNHQIHRITVRGLSAGLVDGADADTQNILMVGSTTGADWPSRTRPTGSVHRG